MNNSGYALFEKFLMKTDFLNQKKRLMHIIYCHFFLQNQTYAMNNLNVEIGS